MALTRDRGIRCESDVEYLEHITGKKVKSWERDYCSNGTNVLFSDGTYTLLQEGQRLDPRDIKYYAIPESYCACCGERAHVGYVDWAGRCEVYLKNFWKKARKVYWYRYLKNK